MSVIGEAALSALFDVLFDKLISSDLLNIFKQEQVDADLKKWKTMLQKIRAVLDDAEEKQVTSRSVKLWLDDLEDLAYDADDILDEFSIEAFRRKLINAEPSTSRVRKFIPTCCVGLTPTSIMFDANMRSKIKVINKRLQEIVTQKNDLQLTENTGGRTRTTRSRDPDTSLVNEDHVYGRDKDKKAIVDLLLSVESSNTRLGLCFSVIPILGMGGLGKTTLAQLVYNDDYVRRHFDLKAWVCVSEDYDTARVTKEILQDIIKQTCNDSDLNLLQHKLKDQLSGKKFLLILDDVWNENQDDWSNLCKPFEFGAQGSKIIITTRNDGVTSTMGATQPYKLEELSNDACLTIFTQNALGTTDFSAHPELEEIGRNILERCKGSPLAAKVLGGLCRRTSLDRDRWERVLNSKMWDIPEEKSSIFPILKLSYQYLPSHLKRCFAYCSLFPKDYVFKEKELVLLWMAEGLVKETKRNESMEDLGGEYFRDLLGRSFFQQSSRYCKPHFVMHDLINDLARWAAGGLCYILEDTMGGNMQSKISTKVRHFSYIRCEYDDIKKFEDFPKDMHLRTFLQLLPINKGSHLTNHALSCLLPKLRYLRVLSLGGYEIVQLPDSISNLKHLRYFNLSNTKIRSLPESLSSLYKLQTLILKGCSSLQSLPMFNCTCLEDATIEECNSLMFISGGQLPSTLKRLEIRKCEKLQSVVDEGEAPSSSLLMNEENLNTSVVLEQLRIMDCSSLKCLSSRGDLPATLKILKIYTCSELTSLSSSGQLPTALKHLAVSSCPKLESVADKLHNNVSLERLSIRYCEKLKSLPEGLHKLCHLSKMKIEGCSSLVSFPDGGLLPTSLRELSIDRCKKLEALPNRMHNLTSLHQLILWGYGSIISFPEEGYPTNLTSLSLSGVNICKQVFEWGLHKLTSLTYLWINSEGGFPDWQSFPSEEEDGKMMMTLPTSLTTLFINSFPNIVFLSSKGFQNLSALQHLEIYNCPKLEFLPEKGLPPSLLRLYIYKCPLLKQHCKKGKGREWLKIANIPQVLIHGRSVFEVEEEEQ